MALGIDGLVSGLDTTSLINSLIQAEAAPQTILKSKATAQQTYVSALQTLNSSVAALATKAREASAATSLDVYAGASSSAAVTVSTTGATSAGSIEIVVGATARGMVGVTAASTSWPSDPPTLTFTSSSGATTEVTARSGSLDDVVTAVNASAAGVRAVKIASGTDAAGEPRFRLQFTSASTGAAGAFTVHAGSAAEVAAGSAADVLAAPGAAVTATARDASVTLWAGTSAEQVVTSSTNTFSALLPGVDVTVAATSADPVTLTVTRDAAKAAAVASDLVKGVTDLFSYISSRTAVTTTTSSTGAATVRAGAFTGDSTVRDVQQRLTSALAMPTASGSSPSVIGLSITRTGTFELDEAAFTAALEKDPVGTQSVLAELAGRLATVAERASDKYDGTLTQTVTGQQSVATDLTKQIENWDSRLAARRAQLVKTYSALEVQLSNLQSQSNWLSGQISSLAASSGSS